MSIDLMSRVWKHSAHSGTELLVLLALADMANDEGICWPGKTRLAEKCRVSKRQLKRIISSLEASGELIVMRRSRVAQRWDTNMYKICAGVIHDPTPGVIHDPTPGVIHDPTLGSSMTLPWGHPRPYPGVIHDPRVGSSMTPESSNKSSSKPKGNGAADAAENLTPLDDDDEWLRQQLRKGTP
jgi:hypothetical protein